MGKYLWHGAYSVEGIKGVLREGGTGRVDAVRKLVEGLGGRLESMYFAFGKDDYYITVDLPDDVSAAAAAMTVAAAGAASVDTVVLLTADELDQATHKSVSYRPPGA